MDRSSRRRRVKAEALYEEVGGFDSLLERADFFRLDATRKLDPGRRTQLGQFLTPAPTARLMASMFEVQLPSLTLLDAGAGVGSLSAAWIAQVCGSEHPPKQVAVTAYEIDPSLAEYLTSTLQVCAVECERVGISMTWQVLKEDFIKAAVAMLRGGFFARQLQSFNCAILNPPYHKINSDSETRHLLRTIGVETSNLYTAFLWLVIRLLDAGGELVAITPRSFCNGPYFRPFRKALLEETALRHVHVFDSRERAFRDDSVLQENVIFHAIKGAKEIAKVIISSSTGPEDEHRTVRELDYEQVVRPNDPDSFIHIVPDDLSRQFAERMTRLTASLSDLDIVVSTGRVVDFRAKQFLRLKAGKDTVPLIYPCHFASGFVKWPKENSRKPNALAVVSARAEDLLVPAGTYVLVKRFSAKEEPRRVVAAIYDPGRVSASRVGFENHLNYYHRNGKGLPVNLAKGLATFLNSTLVDSYFRLFNGHTQVNATDLRSLSYPTGVQLEALGSQIGDTFPDQDELDHLIDEELFRMSDHAGRPDPPDPIPAKKKIQEALAVLKALGLPGAQQNERSALTLLALLDLKPDTPWSHASGGGGRVHRWEDPSSGVTGGDRDRPRTGCADSSACVSAMAPSHLVVATRV